MWDDWTPEEGREALELLEKYGWADTTLEDLERSEIEHHGIPGLGPSNHCKICGRPLSDPKSIKRGIGPVCWEKVLADPIAQGDKDYIPPYYERTKLTARELVAMGPPTREEITGQRKLDIYGGMA